MKDLALTREERAKVEKGEVLIDVDRLLGRSSKRRRIKMRRLRLSRIVTVRSQWERERPKLRRLVLKE